MADQEPNPTPNDGGPPPPAPPAPPAGDPPAPPADPAAAGPAFRPEGVPDEFWDAESGLKTGEMTAALTAAKQRAAELEELRGAVPEAAEGYELALPDDFTVEDGFTVDLDPKDPTLNAAREAAMASGMTVPEWRKALKVHAALQIADQKAARDAAGAELIKLGDRAKDRIEAAKNWVGATFPKPMAEYLLSTPFAAAQIEAFEHMQSLKGDEMPGGPTAIPPAPPVSRADRMYGSQGTT